MSEAKTGEEEKSSLSSDTNEYSPELKSTSDNSGIVEVFKDNFIEEMKNLSRLLEEYNYVGMDTEFPGTVYNVDNMTEDFYYRTLKRNVDKLKLIQFGITLKKSKR